MQRLALLIAALGVGLLAAQSCTKRLATRPDSYAGRQLLAGSGGGFTGFTTTYILLDNGQLFRKHHGDTTYLPLGKQKRALVRRFFTAAEDTCQIKTTRYDQPGNRSRFVGWQQGEQTYRVTWSVADTAVPAAYPALYNAFMAMIPDSVRLN
ncbi:FAD-binding oxidoreductase [Spirosoma sp. 209]|uniref:FAD-binding oxidoreductase n=1 Tax=Spirosoma sp. 209 TaxID=1955701 RepID=UPI001F3ECA4C|nr:FAD-binding oxidoreductase [Spirosoma sp. 209]